MIHDIQLIIFISSLALFLGYVISKTNSSHPTMHGGWFQGGYEIPPLKPQSRGIRIRRNWWQIILEVCQGRQKNGGKNPGRFDDDWVSTNPQFFF